MENNLRKRIVFIQTAHLPFDDRVFYHQKPALEQKGCCVDIISTKSSEKNEPHLHCFDDFGLSKKQTIQKINQILSILSPDVMICDNPISVFAAIKAKKIYKNAQIIYDVTEWYPSKKNLFGLNFIQKFFKSIVLRLLNIYAGIKIDGFIFGEYYKSKFFRFIFPPKKFIYLPYYPDLKYIKQHPEKTDFSIWRLFYAGNLTKEKGINNVINVAIETAIENQDKKIILNIVGRKINEEYLFPETLPQNLEIQLSDFIPFPQFCRSIGENDIFLDLRTDDCENTKCLPIKLFYYMGCGCPSIFSNLKAIPKDVPDFKNFCFLVKPNDIKASVNIINAIISDKILYKQLCDNAIKSSTHTYNWEQIETKFTKFILEK